MVLPSIYRFESVLYAMYSSPRETHTRLLKPKHGYQARRFLWTAETSCNARDYGIG
jgi:hypothetical protein